MQPTKRCGKCDLIKPKDQFARNKRERDGLQSWCRACSCEYARSRYAANRGRLLAEMKTHRDENRDAVRVTKKAYQDAAREKAIEIYGGKCRGCGSKERIEFDHVHGDGSEHRKIERTSQMIRRIVRMGRALDDWSLQLLCMKCHNEKTSAELAAKGGRRGVRKTHCPKGHVYGGSNLMHRKNGAQRCRTCSKASNLASYYRSRARLKSIGL